MDVIDELFEIPVVARGIDCVSEWYGARKRSTDFTTGRSSGMERLRCKTPEMAVKALWVYLPAYNPIRLLMAWARLAC